MSSLATDGLRAETAAAVDAVSAGLRLAIDSAASHEVSIKQGRDVVTTADLAVESTMRALLADAFDMPCVGEEHGGEAPRDGSGYWLIDPICGTRNYASLTPLYCVNLALVEAGQVTLAAVGDPWTGDVAVAERGGGAWALAPGGRRRLAVSDDSRTVIVEDGRATGRRLELAAAFTERLIRADRWDFRSLSTTLSSRYVATGAVSAYVVFHLTPLHGAAGVLLAAEAGATVSDVDGEAWDLGSDTLVAAASPRTHDALLALMPDVA